MSKKIRVTVWNEFRHERSNPDVKAIYPDGIHRCIAEFLGKEEDIEVTAVALDDPENGLPDELLNNTDVLLWWGHMCHGEVPDALVEKIRNRVFEYGMGFIPLHSAHKSKPFQAIVGTSGNLLWGAEQQEIIWNILPSHPIAAGLPEHFIIDSEEMYGEPFMIPQPDAVVFSSWYKHGNIFRSGCCFLRGLGKVFYFQPGHETSRSFHNPNVQLIIKNAVRWAAPGELACRYPSSCDFFGDLV